MKIISSFLEKIYVRLATAVKKEKNAAVLFCGALLLLTLPMFIVGAYSHPSADDYTFCYYTYKAAKNTEGIGRIFAVLYGACQAVKTAYEQWSGYYTGSFFAALRPNFYNENLAFFNSFILLCGLLVGIFWFAKKLFHDMWGFTKSVSVMVASVIALGAIQFVPSAAETFYWYTAGVTYTLLYGMSLVLMANVMVCVYKTGMTRGACIANAILAFIVAGGILPVNIPVFGILTAILLDAFFSKRLKTDKKNKIRSLIVYGIFLAGILIGSLSPSTFWRLESLGEGEAVSLFSALLYSAYGNLQTAIGFLTPATVLLLLLIAVVTVVYIKNVQYEFRHPFFVLLVSYCVLFAAYFPIYYGTGFKLQYADSRYKSILFFHFILLAGINTVYLTGWLYRKAENAIKDTAWDWTKKAVVTGVCAFAALFLLGTVAKKDGPEPWSLRVLKDFANGTIKQYDTEMDARYADYLDESKPVITVTAPTVAPACIRQAEPSDEEGASWTVDALIRYFAKEKIIVE